MSTTVFCTIVQNWTQLGFLRFFAKLKNFTKLWFFAILVIFAIFVKFALANVHYVTNLNYEKCDFFAILVIFTIFVKFVVLVEPFNKFQLANITNSTWISLVLLTCCLIWQEITRTANSVTKVTVITNFRSFRKFCRRVHNFCSPKRRQWGRGSQASHLR